MEFHSDRPLIMGILNVTPDSFSDGGCFLNIDAAIERAVHMVAEGADIIDLGPESTRPGADLVSATEQINRAVPVISAIRKEYPDIAISIDTRLAPVAQAALDAGATIVNDISAATDDEEMLQLVAGREAAVVLMHMQGRPATMQQAPQYDDVVEEVVAYLTQRAQAAVTAGIAPSRIAIDPGIGFGKTLEHNIEIMRNLEAFVGTGHAVLLGVSRKSFIGAIADEPDPVRRLPGSLACVARALEAGVQIVRVHDVWQTRQMIEVLSRIIPARPTS